MLDYIDDFIIASKIFSKLQDVFLWSEIWMSKSMRMNHGEMMNSSRLGFM